MPAAFRWIALANPITWQVDVLRHASIGLGSVRIVAAEAAAFVLFSAASFVLARVTLEREP